MSIIEIRKELNKAISLINDPALLCDIFFLLTPTNELEIGTYSPSVSAMLEQRRREYSNDETEMLSWQDLQTRVESYYGIKR